MDSTELGLVRRDFTPMLKQACERFIEAAAGAEAALSSKSPDASGSPLLDRRLVQMTVAEHQISRLVLPVRDALEYFGLPRSITARALDPEPTVRVQDPAREAWDFRPWLSEKVSYIRDNLHALLETVETLTEMGSADGTATHNQRAAMRACEGSAGSEHASCDHPLADDSSDEGSPAEPSTVTLMARLTERAVYEARSSAGYARDIVGAIESMGLTVVDWRISAGGE
ncbi:MAG: hypothetical protein LC772_12720 [Chloroflexi bacterium]|nr:hypothetical protein [Chloroflexota bacterium]